MASRDHVFTSIGSGNRPTRSTRSWTDANGVHYTVDSTSWSGPGISFGAMTGSANGGLRSFTTPLSSSRPRSGLFGNAFGLLDDLLSTQQQRQHDEFVTSMGQGQAAPRSRARVEVESDTDDEDLTYENEVYERNPRSRPKSMFGRLKDKLLDGKQRPRRSRESSHERSYSHSRERSPVHAPQPQPERRRSSYRTDTREPTWSQAPRERTRPEFIEVDYEEDDEEEVIPPVPRRSTAQPDLSILEALESVVESERRAVRACKKRLEQAIRQPGTSSSYLQRMVDELKGHEISLTQAQNNLDEAKAGQTRSSRPRPQSFHPRMSQQQQPQPRRTQSRSFEDEFLSPFDGFPSFFSAPGSQHPDPIFRAFEELDSFGPFGRGGFAMHEQMFGNMRPESGNFRYFSSPNGVPPSAQQRKGARYSTHNAAPPPNVQFSTFAPPPPPPPQPPANLLKPEEAKCLFKIYNEHWNNLSPSDPNIPYPARNLQARNLTTRDSIWAPTCNAPVATWSDEDIMKSNAQAFYLGVVGLTPEYSESSASGRILMGFDRGKANPAQVKVLVDLLKKERMRWHSDRLGKRNGNAGGEGVNEGLQRDVRARAVFHAVCELIEWASQ
ncbi:Hypothetical predicted protein [Lecanosticta acicola]|uniref:Uncharacterized protein n=1 Tax=Lecanosticta acicola TaxID=111012 RepID=A0AAI8YZU2_9PEZI|nr:Hypothetical predicted protein [Lecanosticta acicola]